MCLFYSASATSSILEPYVPAGSLYRDSSSQQPYFHECGLYGKRKCPSAPTGSVSSLTASYAPYNPCTDYVEEGKETVSSAPTLVEGILRKLRYRYTFEPAAAYDARGC
jgi:hypothetical protein